MMQPIFYFQQLSFPYFVYYMSLVINSFSNFILFGREKGGREEHAHLLFSLRNARIPSWAQGAPLGSREWAAGPQAEEQPPAVSRGLPSWAAGVRSYPRGLQPVSTCGMLTP